MLKLLGCDSPGSSAGIEALPLRQVRRLEPATACLIAWRSPTPLIRPHW